MGTVAELNHVPVREASKDYSGRKFVAGTSFVKQDLRGAKFRGASCVECDFSDADLSNADFEGANCYGANFTNSKCNKTNFKDCVLAASLFFPVDCFGMTLTMRCETFDNMKVSRFWWWSWIYFALMIEPKNNKEEGLHDKLINMIGTERYLRLRRLFPQRSI